MKAGGGELVEREVTVSATGPEYISLLYGTINWKYAAMNQKKLAV